MPTRAERQRDRLAAAIAAAFLDGPWQPTTMAARAASDLGFAPDAVGVVRRCPLARTICADAASHAFRPRRSVHTFAAPHVGCQTLIRLDLENFFTSINPGAVLGVFRSAGYPEQVAHCLTGLVTNAVPPAVLGAATPPIELRSRHRHMLSMLRQPHLPQGAQTSPALANLAAYGLDCRLNGLAEAFGAAYTRYADDLAFSGGRELTRRSAKFVTLASEIITDETFSVNHRKTRIAGRAHRQILTGIVVNESPNVPRPDFDRLKAVLHDAASHGPSVANRDGLSDFRAHLLGRISWVAASNPQRAERLRRTFDAVDWSPRLP